MNPPTNNTNKTRALLQTTQIRHDKQQTTQIRHDKQQTTQIRHDKQQTTVGKISLFNYLIIIMHSIYPQKRTFL